MKIDKDTVVNITYSLNVREGENPPELNREHRIEFIYGRCQTLPILEQALTGHLPGDSVDINIPAEQAFGRYDKKLVNRISLSDLKYPERLEVGKTYEEMTASGRPMRFTVRELHDDYVLADFNHPAAGKDITLRANVTGVRAASPMDIMRAVNMNRGCG
jgi:FKBP-type peptidyl-prolyl cis-trans isomerase SlyD